MHSSTFAKICLLLNLASLVKAFDDECLEDGVVYGNPKLSKDVPHFTTLLGVACANTREDNCFDKASQWSSVAIQHGNNPVVDAEACSNLCNETEGCDVYTFWPDGIRTTESSLLPEKCLCPESQGAEFLYDEPYCWFGECGVCEDLYFFFSDHEEEDLQDEFDLTCDSLAGFLYMNGCCVYPDDYEDSDEQDAESGACELFSAEPDRFESVIGFSDIGNTLTGPLDCEKTQWLPFLDDTEERFEEEEDDDQIFGDAGSCDVCPSEYGYRLLWFKQYYDDESGEMVRCRDAYSYFAQVEIEGASCPDLASWFIDEVECCIPPGEEVQPTPAPTIDEKPRASDGRLCWVEGYSYGVEADGACENAEMIAVYTRDDTIELGETQGWWKSAEDPNKEIDVISFGENDLEINDCHAACETNDECGGWEFRKGSCILKSRIDCSPSLARSSSTDVTAGVNGCVDANSKDPLENSALNLSNLWFSECDLPRCTAPHNYGGTWAGATYIPNFQEHNSCFYKQYTPDEIYSDCAEDRWIVINGGSNALTFYLQMVKLFAPLQRAGLDPLVDFDDTFEYGVIDLVLESKYLPILDARGILHTNKKRFCDIDKRMRCQYYSLEFQGGNANWGQRHQAALESMFSEAPYKEGTTRLTLIVGQIWNNAEVALKAVENASKQGGWENAEIIFYGQAMVWYPCNIEQWCNQPELGRTNDELFQKYESDLKGVMEVGKTTCATDRYSCFFATHAYEEGVFGKARQMISILESATAEYDWAHFIDWNGFTLNDEIVEGHTTPAAILPVFNMLWNTVCDGPSTGCPEAVHMEPACWTFCEELGGGDACESCNGEDWICLGERQCDYEILDPVPWDVALAPPPYDGTDQDSLCFDASIFRLPDVHNDVHNFQFDECRRVWCGSVGAGWAVGLFLFLLGLALACGVHRRMRKSKDAVNQVPDTTKDDLQQTTGGDSEPSEETPSDSNENSASAVLDDVEQASVPQNSGEQTPQPAKEHLSALGFARFLASLHIVLGHLYAKGAIANVYFFGWGYTWVPWFFVLSGYVLTHARLNSSKPERVDGPYKHISKRLSTIFPMYAFGVFLTAMIRIGKDVELPGYDILIAQSFLTQSWIPLWTEQALLSQCWFLSNLVIYWALFAILYRSVRKLTIKWACSLLALICFLPWLIVIVPATNDQINMTWYKAHDWQETDSRADIWTIMLKFHPIFYLHVFVFGMVLAVLRHRLKVEEASNSSPIITLLRWSTKIGATLGYLGLILLFTIDDIKPPANKLSARLSVLLPLQGLMMLGLSPLPQTNDESGWQDPLAFLFSFAPSWLGDVSYCQYVLQFAMFELFPRKEITDISFFLYLMGAALLCYKLIHVPAANMWRKHLQIQNEEKAVRFLPSARQAMILFIPPTILASALLIAKGIYTPSKGNNIQPPFLYSGAANLTNFTNSSASALEAAFIRIDSEAVDLRLNWTAESSSNDSVIINPSMLFLQDGDGLKLVRAAREHSVHREDKNESYEGEIVMHQILKFNSSILLREEIFSGDLSAGFDDYEKWGLDGSDLPLKSTDAQLLSHIGKGEGWTNLCEPPPIFDAENKHLVRKQVNGPEDPKLFEMTSSQGNSNWGLTFSSFPPAALFSESSSQDECQWNEDANMQMYLASDGQALALNEPAVGVRLQCGDPSTMEKNWIAFTYGEGHLYYVYTIEPHVVVHVREADGACVVQHETSSPQLEQVANQVSAIRGSATAVRYSQNEFLALFHTYKDGFYSTSAYTFEARPPFAIKRISKPLPLHPRAFASSLSVQSGKVIIGYGDADMGARVLVMSLAYLEEHFDWCQK